MTQPKHKVRVTTDVAKRVLERAALLDLQRDGKVSVQELRAAAIEAGISAESFNEALLAERSPSDRRKRVARVTSLAVIAIVTITLIVTVLANRPRLSTSPTAAIPELTP
jgi:hypothetical protein